MLAFNFVDAFLRGTGSMDGESKLHKMLKTRRDPREVQDWIFSLTPLGVAFVFFFFLIMPMDIPDKRLVMVLGVAAGFAGLQSYWIFRGWRKSHASTVLLGVMGLGLVMGLVWLYLSLV
jgi:hypothetical protein